MNCTKQIIGILIFSVLCQLSQECLTSSSDSKKAPKKGVLLGIHNTMPGIGSSSNRDYVILGRHAEWENDSAKIPIALKLSDGQRQEVKKEKLDYICRGLDLSMIGTENDDDFTLQAQLEYSDKTLEQVIVKVQNVS